MKLIELTRLTGTKFAVNPDYVNYVAKSENGTTNIVLPSGSVFAVKEDYNTVIGLLTDEGAPTAYATAAPSWGGPR